MRHMAAKGARQVIHKVDVLAASSSASIPVTGVSHSRVSLSENEVSVGQKKIAKK